MLDPFPTAQNPGELLQRASAILTHLMVQAPIFPGHLAECQAVLSARRSPVRGSRTQFLRPHWQNLSSNLWFERACWLVPNQREIPAHAAATSIEDSKQPVVKDVDVTLFGGTLSLFSGEISVGLFCCLFDTSINVMNPDNASVGSKTQT